MATAPPEPVTHRPLRFLLVGGWNVLFGYVLMLVLTAVAESLGGSWRWVAVPSQLLAALNGFICHRTFVFPDMPADFRTFVRYNANSAGIVILALVEMYLLIDLAGFPSWAVQTAILPVNVGLTYILHHRVTFRAPTTIES